MLSRLRTKLTLMLSIAISLIIIIINLTVVVIFYQQNSLRIYESMGKVIDNISEETLMAIVPKVFRSETETDAPGASPDEDHGTDGDAENGGADASYDFGANTAVFVEVLDNTFRGSFKYPHVLSGSGYSSSGEGQLSQYALDISDGDSARGVKGFVLYCRKDFSAGSLILFSNDETFMEKVRSLIGNSVAICAIGIILSVWISRLVSGRMVKPIEETLDEQHEFISDVSHELKTPLAVINANAEALESESGENKWVGSIRSEALRMSGLINELLAASRLEKSDMQKTFTRTDLSSIVNETVMTFDAMAFERGALIDTDIHEGIFIEGSPEKLHQLAAILLDNAVKYVNENGRITVSLYTRFANTVLEVANTGSFIEKDKTKKIFERFYRIDESRTSEGKYKSYGLGLSIARTIAEEHGGSISVSSKRGDPDVTTFKVVV